MSKVDDLKKQIQELETALAKEQYKAKSRKGVLKEGDWLRQDWFDYDEESDKWIPSESDPVVYYRSPDGVVCLNAYVDEHEDYISDYFVDYGFEKATAKKITKEEAMTLL